MEELAAADGIQKEILDDARSRAEHVLKQADQQTAHIVEAAAEKLSRSVMEIQSTNAARIRREREELQARVPLDKARLRLAMLDRRLQGGLDQFLKGFGEGDVAGLAARLVRRGASQLAGRALELRYRGISSACAEATLRREVGEILSLSLIEDVDLVAAGMVVRTVEEDLVVRATMDLVREELADRNRGDLASALCAEEASP